MGQLDLLGRLFVADDSYDVELIFVGDAVRFDVGVGRDFEMASALKVDGGDRIAKIGRPCFDLDENDAAAIHGDDVGLIMSAPPIGLDDSIAYRGEILGSELFTPLAESIVPSHGDYINNVEISTRIYEI